MSRENQHEVWVPVLGYEDYYEVSNLGRVRSKPRKGKKKMPYGMVEYKVKPCVLKQRNKLGYHQVGLYLGP